MENQFQQNERYFAAQKRVKSIKIEINRTDLSVVRKTTVVPNTARGFWADVKTARNYTNSKGKCKITNNYNKKKITNHCETCGYIPTKNSVPLDTHHIEEQKNCDEHGFVNNKHYHKNKRFNLVSLCKNCHLKIDTGELVIRGYKQTTDGIILDYTFNI